MTKMSVFSLCIFLLSVLTQYCLLLYQKILSDYFAFLFFTVITAS